MKHSFLQGRKERGRKEEREGGREKKKNTSEDKIQTFTHQNLPERIIERQIASLSYFILFLIGG